jgi:hypothetical protein
MKQCNNKIKNSCTGSKTYAACAQFEGDVNEDSALVDETCLSLEETTQDLYDQVGAIKNNQDLSDLGNACLTYVEDEDGKIIVKNVLLKLEEEICSLKERINLLETTAICDMPVGDCVDTLCLTGACDTSIVTYGDLLNAMVAKICETT